MVVIYLPHPIHMIQDFQLTPSFDFWHVANEFFCKINFDDYFETEPIEVSATSQIQLTAKVNNELRKYFMMMLEKHKRSNAA